MITSKLISKCEAEPFFVWAEFNAPDKRKDHSTGFKDLMRRRGNLHEDRILKTFFPDAVRLSFKNELEGGDILKTLLGEKHIANIPLQLGGMKARLSVIERDDSRPSSIGFFHYTLKDIRVAKHIRNDHIIQSAFHNHLLGIFQGYTPEFFSIINNSGEELSFRFSDYEEKLMSAIAKVKELAESNPPMPVFNGVDFPWTSFANEVALANKDLSLLPGVGGVLRQRLFDANICSIDDLKNANKSDLLELNIDENIIDRWKLQISSLEKSAPIMIKSPNLKSVKNEVFFDVEGDYEFGTDYLYGILLRNSHGCKYIPFWSSDEKELWESFCTFMGSMDEFNIYAYSPHELNSLKKMILRYGCDEVLQKRLIESVVDLFSVLKSSFVLPLYGFTLKDVAGYLGYKWRSDDASGANSIGWYSKHRQGDSDMKQKILDYNEDDVKALLLLKDWLCQQDRSALHQ